MKKTLRVLSVVLLLSLSMLQMAGCTARVENETVPATPPPETGASTPLGDLAFPEMWGGNVTVEETSSGEQFRIRFNGRDGNAETQLFELSIGPNGEGYLIGSAPDPSGTQQMIWLNIREIEPKNGWTEEQIEQLNLLQSGVNDLLDQFYSLDGFEQAEN